MSFAVTPKIKGEEEKVATAIKRLAEEDPTLRLRRDPQTGEEILAGMSQMHVEVALERAKRRFGVDVELHQPRVPYLETIRSESRARHRYKKQTGGRGQFGDCEIVLEPIEGHQGYEFVDKIVGGVIPQSYRPAVDKGIQEAMQHGELAGAPIQGVRVELVDGQYHNVDSSEMAFKIAGSMAFKEAYAKADPVLLEPIMELEVTVPDEAVGAVNGDLNSRRGRLNGMEPAAGMTTIKAEVPMAELLTYSQSLTSMTGGRGDYAMHLLRYEQVPTHVAQKIVDETKKAREAANASGGQAAHPPPACRHGRGLAGFDDLLEALEHRLPVGTGLGGRVLGGVVVLAQREIRLSLALLELVDEGVVVLGTVLETARRAEMRQLEEPRALDFDDLALVLVRLPLVLALPDDRATGLPVGRDARAEHVLLDLVGIGESVPDLLLGRVDLGFRCGDVVGHVFLRVEGSVDCPTRSAPSMPSLHAGAHASRAAEAMYGPRRVRAVPRLSTRCGFPVRGL